ncbi:MAG TPA: branched-chain amino acid ABC transporter permease [Candidatus Choladousia intestinavium]|uniref:Branched-chain amino acid ABC transporter permease n=1 Tax=Candidatus Choladousia intestinavium TaxID=2840727 RepID=A0A9D1D9J8_9FIRM|nr:branched-chain amino acid ABC transporter permease [Candidatus Choladousia intestinavium]
MKENKKYIKILLIVAAAVVLLLLPRIISNSYYQMLINQTMINSIVVMGLNYITGMTGQMNMGTGGIYALGAYGMALLTTKTGASPWLGLLLAVVLGLIIGRGLGYPSLRISGIYLALTTIAFAEVVRLLLTNWVNFTGGAIGVQGIPKFSIFGFTLDTDDKYYYLLLVITVILAVIAKRIISSKWGRVFQSIKDNPDAAEACGVNIAQIKILAFTLAAIYGCIGGALYSCLMGYISSNTFNQDLSINYLIMMMLGGIGSVAGNILGAGLVTILPEMLRVLENYYWLIFSIIMLVFAVFMPYGLVSVPRKVMDLIGRRKRQQ